jgi:hypothetical protein
LATEVLERLRDAQNRHDLDAFVACFDPDYRMRGVTIFGVREDRIAWRRLYLEEVEVAGQGIEQAVQQMAGESGRRQLHVQPT